MKKILKSISYALMMGTFFASFSALADEDFDAWKKTFEKEAKNKRISIIKKEYKNVGHVLTPEMQDDVRQFFN